MDSGITKGSGQALGELELLWSMEVLDVAESAGVYETHDSAVRSNDFRCWWDEEA